MAQKRGSSPNMVVGSRIRDYVRSKKMRISGNVPAALNAAVCALLDEAMSRAKANNRSTMGARDL